MARRWYLRRSRHRGPTGGSPPSSARPPTPSRRMEFGPLLPIQSAVVSWSSPCHLQSSLCARKANRIRLEDSHRFPYRTQLRKVAQISFAESPVWLVTQPAETQVEPRGSESSLEVTRRTVTPARL